MTATKKTKLQNKVMEKGFGVCIGVKRVNGEYISWLLDSGDDDSGRYGCPEDPSVWPTIGEAVESIVWQCVDVIIEEHLTDEK